MGNALKRDEHQKAFSPTYMIVISSKLGLAPNYISANSA